MRVPYVLTTGKDGKELTKIINQFRAEVIFFDAHYYQDVTARKIGMLLQDIPGLNVAVFNMDYLAPKEAAYYLLYGAKSYLDLSGSGSFWRGLKSVIGRKEYVVPAVKTALENISVFKSEIRLDTTGRQEDVKRFMLKGLKAAEIAKVLKVSVCTVNNHKTALYKQYGVDNALALFRKCFMLGELTNEQLAMSN